MVPPEAPTPPSPMMPPVCGAPAAATNEPPEARLPLLGDPPLVCPLFWPVPAIEVPPPNTTELNRSVVPPVACVPPKVSPPAGSVARLVATAPPLVSAPPFASALTFAPVPPLADRIRLEFPDTPPRLRALGEPPCADPALPA